MDMTQLEELPTPLSSFSLEAAYQELTLTEDAFRLAQLSQRVLDYLEATSYSEFENALQMVVKLYSTGRSNLLTESPTIALKIVAHFVKLVKSYRLQGDQALQYRFRFMLSILAELVRKDPTFQVPMDREFLDQLFEIEAEQVNQEIRAKLLAILGVLYYNIGKQARLLRGLKMEKRLKTAILNNYPLIAESFTLKLFNKCIVDLQLRRVVLFTLPEMERYGVKKALMMSMGEDKSALIGKYLERLFPNKRS